jgi:hypothetical protein
MKKTIKKLGLQRESIRYLTGGELPMFAGGISSDTQRGSVCINGGCPGGDTTGPSVSNPPASGLGIATCTCPAHG